METARERERERLRAAEEDRAVADGRAEALGEFFKSMGNQPEPEVVHGVLPLEQ